ncbi:MAG: FkbM family methyltransferase [Gammaproteobacteria bacterium]
MTALNRLRRLTSDAYVKVFGGARTRRLNEVVLDMALRARGFGNSGSIDKTGEASFIALLARGPVDVCLDVGANCGEYSEALLEKASATVIAFEPLPQTYANLIGLEARYPRRLIAVNKGVGDVEGHLDLHWGDNSQLASFSKEVLAIEYVGACNVRSTSVPVTTLDCYFAGEGQAFANREITLLKIDTEGFEYEVLMGARRTLGERRPRFVQIEFNHHQLLRGHTLYSISRLLPDYRVYQILPGNRGLFAVRAEDPLTNTFGYANFVLVRPDVRF